PAETREWLDALDSVEAFEGIGRVDELLDGIVQAARRKGAKLPFAANTAYVNTIAPHDEPAHPGDRTIEHKIRSLIRWNAAAIVLRANKTSSELGGHIASFQSAATRLLLHHDAGRELPAWRHARRCRGRHPQWYVQVGTMRLP